MGRENELSSPQNKLKDIIHTIFKRNDQQVAGEGLPATGGERHDGGHPPAAAASPGAAPASAAPAEAPQLPHQQQPKLQCLGHADHQSLGTVDVGDKEAASTANAAGRGGASTTNGAETSCLPDDSSTVLDSSADGSKAAKGETGSTGGPAQPAAWNSCPQGVLCSVQDTPGPAAAASQTSAQTSMQQQLASEAHAAVQPPAYPGGSNSGSVQEPPWADSSSKGPAGQGRKVLCASVDDLYQELFGDVPLPSACSSTSHSPYGSGLGSSLRGLSSMSPMTTSSAFCHQHAAAAAIAGSGGMPGLGLIPVGPPMPSIRNSTSLCSSCDGTHGDDSNYGGGGGADSSTCGDCPFSSTYGTPRVHNNTGMDDLLPPGAYPPRVRVAAQQQTINNNNNSNINNNNGYNRFSGSDGGSSCMFADESPSYCSSSAGGGQTWPLVGGHEDASGAASTRSSGLGWGSRASAGYNSPHQHPSTSAQQDPSSSCHSPLGGGASAADDVAGSLAAAGGGGQGSCSQHNWAAGEPGPAAPAAAAQPSKSIPRSSLRTRWSNWINGSGATNGDSSTSGSGRSPRGRAPPGHLLQQQQDGQQQDGQPGQAPAPWLLQSQPSSPRCIQICAQSAPGNAVAQALYNSASSGNNLGALPLQQHQQQHLVHCHSNPELTREAAGAAYGGQARLHNRRSLGMHGGAGGGVPPCARSLFGIVPQMERPLIAASSLGHNSNSGSNNSSSGWLLSGTGCVAAAGLGGPMRSEGIGVLAALAAGDDALSVASTDEEVIRQVNADNVLSSTWGPNSVASHSAAGATGSGSHQHLHHSSSGSGSGHHHHSHPKLLAFKYCCATSPLNHPGRASPFSSARNSPFNSPRGPREVGLSDLMPLRAAATATSCPGSPLGVRHSNPFSNASCATSSSNHHPLGQPAPAACTSSAHLTATMSGASSSGCGNEQRMQQDLTGTRQGVLLLNKQQDSSQQHTSYPAATTTPPAAASCSSSSHQHLDAPPCLVEACSISSSGDSSSCGGSSSSKPPLQSKPVRGLLRTPPPLPLPLPLPQPPAATTGLSPRLTPGRTAQQQQQQHGMPPAEGVGQQEQATTGPGHDCKPARAAAAAGGYTQRVSAPAGLSALMQRLGSSSSSGADGGSTGSCAAATCSSSSSSRGASPASGVSSAVAVAGAEEAMPRLVGSGDLSSIGGAAGAAGGSAKLGGVPLPLPSCSIDVGSPKQLLPAGSGGGAAAGAAATGDSSRCSPRRQSSSRLGASGGFTTPSRLSHNSTIMGEALLAASSGSGGGFALQRTSSCCSSSSGWAGGGSGSAGPASSSINRSGGRSSSGCAAIAAAGGPERGLLSAASVPLTRGYKEDAEVDRSDSSDGSWTASGTANSTPARSTQKQQHEHQQDANDDDQEEVVEVDDEQHQQRHQQAVSDWGQAEPAAAASIVAHLGARGAAAAAGVAAGRYGSCNGASEVSTEGQECPYPSWCSSSCLSPLATPKQPEQDQQLTHQQQEQQHKGQQQEQRAQQQLERGQAQQRNQQQQPQSVLADAGVASSPAQAGGGSPACAAAVEDDGGGADGVAEAGGVVPDSVPEVDFLEKIGRGSFGDVFKGVWCGSVVAVKVIQVKQPSALNFPQRTSSHHRQRGSNEQPADHHAGEAAAAAAAAMDVSASDFDTQAAQVALELAQHEYESWLNANLRHPHIVQLFTSFTIGLEERSNLPPPPAVVPQLLHSSNGEGEGAAGGFLSMAAAGAHSSGSSGLSWKTHLVMEYCELGTMQDLLQRGVLKQGSIPSSIRLAWVLATAKELCTAVCYLHSMDVVHGDLKSSNVLLKAAAATAWDTRGFVAKVSDFGLSHVMDAISAANGEAPQPTAPHAAAAANTSQEHGATAHACSDSSDTVAAADAAAAVSGCDVGSAGGLSLCQQPVQPRFGALSHAAPELIRGQLLSKASDVYSIGVLLWELLTGQAPFYGMHPGQLLSLKLSHHTSQLLPFTPMTPPSLAQLCLDCWSEEPSQRPSMPAVVQRINDLTVTLLGQEQAVAMFPDVAASLAAQRRQAAVPAAHSS